MAHTAWSSPESHYQVAPGDQAVGGRWIRSAPGAVETESLRVDGKPLSVSSKPRGSRSVEHLDSPPPDLPLASRRKDTSRKNSETAIPIQYAPIHSPIPSSERKETAMASQLCSGEPSDKGASDSGGGSGGQNSGSGGGKKSGSESSNSSSAQQQSGSGSRSGGRRHGGSCSGSGSSGEDEDEDNGDKRRRPHQGGAGKDAKPKLVEDDDEATDSADEGVDDATPHSMVMDFSPPQSNQSENGTDHAPGDASTAAAAASATTFATAMDTSAGYSSQSVGESAQNRPTSLATSINHFENGGGGKDALSAPATPLDTPQGDSGTISIESVVPKESSNSVEPTGNAINMIVGYGVPAASAPPQPVASSSDKSLPGSEIGTPTMDSPPPIIDEKTATPQPTPVPVTPVLSPALSLLPQVC